MTMPGHEPDPRERDPRLQAALRHAPDHDAAPAPELSAHILQAARAAVQAPRQLPPTWWQRLTQPVAAWWRRPAAAAGLAGVVVASLVALMWSGDEAPPAASVSDVAPRGESAPARQPAEPAAPPSSADVAAQAPASTERAEAPAAKPARERAAPPLAQATAPEVKRAPMADAQSGRTMQAAPPARSQHKAEADAGPLPPTLARLAALAQSGGAAWAPWHWQPGPTAGIAPAGAQAQAWLQQLLQHTGGRWTARAAAPSAGLLRDAEGSRTLRWLEGDALAAEVTIEPSAAIWTEPDGRQWSAALSADAARRLRLP
jgi:hypothetical protein